MALGLGFNKAKILHSAEKYVLQGKLPAAIAEYQKILKKDPKDLMALNTVGDLYVRSGQTDEAIKCFYDLAEKSIEAGFVPRAIAVYKRITKIEQDALPALKRLGELYSMQGLMRDARTHYLQAVEIHLRRREPVQAREVFEKILLLDMDNPRLQRRMAELYAETGKKAEAVATYLTAAERFLDTAELAEASAALDALAALDPVNTEAQALRGRVLLEQGDSAKAIETLQELATQEGTKSALESLFRAHMNQDDIERASEVAQQVFEKHDDFSPLAELADVRIKKGELESALQIFQSAAEKLHSLRAFSALIQGLKKFLTEDATNIVALELLWGAYRSSGDAGEGRQIAEQLANAYVGAEQLEQARDVYVELVALEPDVPEHQRLLKQVEARLGGGLPGVEAEVPGEPTPLMAMEAAAAPDEESSRVAALPPEAQAVVKNCLTESELYLTYKQLPRAIETLEKGLEEVPGDASLYEHLLPLYEQIQRYPDAARCAEALTEIYVGQGDGERASRYGKLVASYQQKAQEAESGGVVETSFDSVAMETAEPETAEEVAAEPQVREVDLSMEWATLSDSGTAATESTAIESTVEEIEFYLQAGLGSEASSSIDRLRENAPDHASLPGFEERLAALQTPSAEEEAAVTSPTVEEVSGEAEPLAAESENPPAEIESAAEPAVAESIETAPLDSATAAPPETSEPEMETAVKPAEGAAEPQPEISLPVEASAPGAPEPDLVLDEAVRPQGGSASGFELSLDEPQQEMVAPQTASAPPADPSPQAGGFLDDVFAEFKQDVGEATAAGNEEDIETHYNMGVAFKEMALYDEAIGEFQRVHQLAESTKDYSHVVQCCSLLATCFLEKGMPQLAAKWYQTAINSPGVDAESSLALLYELGSAQELAGDRTEALKSFMEVYARNIDYRNVADRIQELKQNP